MSLERILFESFKNNRTRLRLRLPREKTRRKF
jgi:hypothetical protein